jgi:hypothetical protein
VAPFHILIRDHESTVLRYALPFSAGRESLSYRCLALLGTISIVLQMLTRAGSSKKEEDNENVEQLEDENKVRPLSPDSNGLADI